MGRFDRYIFGLLIRVFGFFVLVLVGVYWVNRIVILLDRYLAEGQSGRLMFELMALSLPPIMLIVLPVAGFVATAYVTNRLYADSEMVVVQATGFSVFRLSRPFVLFGIANAVILSLLAHVVVPMTMGALNDREEALTEAISARLLVPGTFQNPTRGVTVYVREIDADGQLLGLLVTDRREAGRETTYSARSARLIQDATGPVVVMFEGMAQSLETDTQRLSTTRFADFTVNLGSLIPARKDARLDYRELFTPQLLAPGPEIVEKTRRSAEFLFREGQLRFTQALLSIGASVLGFAALMTGTFSRFGLWRQIALALILVVVVKLIDNAAIDLARTEPAMWPVVYLPCLLAALLCLVLLAIADGRLRAGPRRRQPA